MTRPESAPQPVPHDILKKLVDLYAERELPAELEDPLEMAASGDADLRRDMATLRRTVDAVRRERTAYTEETHQRILMKLYAHGAPVESAAPEPAHFQYALPIAG